MNNDSTIEKRLSLLTDELNNRPSIANRVAEELEKRVRVPHVQHPARRRFFTYGRWIIGAVGAAAAAVLMIAAIVGSSASVSFAQVQSALANIRTVIVSRTFDGHPEMQQRMLASVDHDAYRSEHANGAVFVRNRNGKTLLLNTKNKTGQITPGAGFGREGEMPTPIDYLESLQNVEADSVRRLGKKTFDGRTLVGFELPPMHGAKRTVWVDPGTKLPLREEVARIGDIPGTEAGNAAYRMPPCVSTYEFNVEIAADAFSMNPAGYKIVDFREFQAPWHEPRELPDGIRPDQLIITPGKGVGAVEFGMSLEQVIEVFGKPDEEMVVGGLTKDEEVALDELHKRANAENLDVFELNRESRRILNLQPQRVIKREGLRVHYYLLGLDIAIDDKHGVTDFICNARLPLFANFAGKFENGVSMDSSADDVKRQFGKPTREYRGQGHSGMFFEDSRVGFNFNENAAMMQIELFEPKK